MLKEYELTDVEHAELMEACKPVLYIAIGGVPPRSPQENAADAWAALGRKRGFHGWSVQPHSTKGDRFFWAEELVEPIQTPGPKLHLFFSDGPSRSFFIPESDLSDGSPSFAAVKRALVLPLNSTLEMVPVMFQGKRTYLLVDEDGLQKKLPFNSDASTIAGRPIVGPAAIWTGEWK